MGVVKIVRNIRRGRIQKLLCLTTAVGAPALAFEVYLEHTKASFGDKWMWTPVVLTPPLVLAAVAGFYSERAANRWLPVFGALYAVDGVVGIVTHIQGIRKRPGGFGEASYNLVMGPPLLAPGALTMIGGLGVVAAIARREK
jgi:hypothetical protein